MQLLLVHVLFILPIGVIGFLPWPWLQALFLAAAVIANFQLVYKEIGEWIVFLFGLGGGLAVHLGEVFLGYTSFSPVTPFLWAYGFVFIRRLGNLITKKIEMNR